MKLGDAKEKKELEDSDQSGSPPDSLQSPTTSSSRDERMQHCRESRELRGEAFHLWERSNWDVLENVLFPIANFRCRNFCKLHQILLLSVCGYIIEIPIYNPGLKCLWPSRMISIPPLQTRWLRFTVNPQFESKLFRIKAERWLCGFWQFQTFVLRIVYIQHFPLSLVRVNLT